MRAVKASWYGVRQYTSAPARAPVRPVPSSRKSHRAPGRGQEREGSEPQALGDPVGHADPVEDPVERADRERVPEVLVRHGARADRRIPQVDRPSQERRGVEVEVLLAVGAHPARGRQQERDVGQQGQRDELWFAPAAHGGPR